MTRTSAYRNALQAPGARTTNTHSSRLYEMLESRPADRLWHTGFLTLSSHEPFEVPYNRLKDKRQNSFAYTDHCLGEFYRPSETTSGVEQPAGHLPARPRQLTHFQCHVAHLLPHPHAMVRRSHKSTGRHPYLNEPKQTCPPHCSDNLVCHIKTSNTAAISFRHPTPTLSLTPRSATDSCSRTVPV